MKQLNNEFLIDYLDENLSPEEKSEVDVRIQQDATVASELEYLKLAVDTVRLNAIYQNVAAVRQSLNTLKTGQLSTGRTAVRSMYGTGLRIAAIFVMVLGSAVLYKYISVSSQSVYKNQFIPYDLSNTRGVENRDQEADAYRSKNWNLVISLNNGKKVRSNKSDFLAAMAEMQLSHFSEAEMLFQNILANPSNDNSFQEESEYYCALTYLMDHKETKAFEMINKIKADTSHRYYPLVSRISAIDLKIINLKK